MKAVKLPKGKTFEFRSAAPSGKYPWDAILNGELNLLAKGEDFTVETDAMIPKIKTAARRRYKKVKVSKVGPDGEKLIDAIIVQSFDMTEEERIGEDIKRAEEKANRAESNGEESASDETVQEAAPAN